MRESHGLLPEARSSGTYWHSGRVCAWLKHDRGCQDHDWNRSISFCICYSILKVFMHNLNSPHAKVTTKSENDVGVSADLDCRSNMSCTDQASTSNHIRIWCCGFVIASAVIVTISPAFVSSLSFYEWSSVVNDYVMADGHVHRNRTEGWSTTTYGPHGLSAPRTASGQQGPTVMIWGDSFVEAHQVNDSEKIVEHVRRLSSQRGRTNIHAIAVGRSYWSVADYYYNIPAYERLLGCDCHFIVLADQGLKDLCPDENRFYSQPMYHFVRRSEVDVSKNRLIGIAHRWKIQDLLLVPFKVVSSLSDELRGLRFSLGHAGRCGVSSERPDSRVLSGVADPNQILGGWRYALNMLRQSTNKQIVIVYVPDIPRISGGQVVCQDDQSQWSERLAALCVVQGIHYLDMTQPLLRDWYTTGKLSRGFHNGRPGGGASECPWSISVGG